MTNAPNRNCECGLNGNNHEKRFLTLCRRQISLEMSAPTSEGVWGMGIQDRGRALWDENRPRFYMSGVLKNVKYLLTERGCG